MVVSVCQDQEKMEVGLVELSKKKEEAKYKLLQALQEGNQVEEF